MYVYSAADRAAHPNVSDFRRAWLDYWLYLNGEESSTCMAARPITPWMLSEWLLAAHPKRDRALLGFIDSVARQMLRSPQRVLPVAPADRILVGSGKTLGIAPAWLAWADDVAKSDSRVYRTFLIDLLRQSERSGRFSDAAFASRRLSAELAADDWVAGTLFVQSKYAILHEGASPASSVQAFFDDEVQGREFRVEFDLMPIFVSGPLARRRLGSRLAFVTSKVEGRAPSQRAHRLLGIHCTVSAAHAGQALAFAVQEVAAVVRQLRLGDYARTHLPTAARVVPADSEPVWFALPQPFWSSGSERREIRRFPPQILGSSGDSWAAALDHAATAIGIWAEAPHSAASSTWQALEGIGIRDSSLEQACYSIGRRVASYELRAVATKFRRLRHVTVTDGRRPRWHCWNGKDRVEEWAASICQPDSTYFVGKWRDRAPVAWLDPRDGVVPSLWRATEGQNPWFTQRLIEDLRLLYAVRNAMVHRGLRLGNHRLASYVARAGLECLLSLADGSELSDATNHRADGAN